jgi:uncharacterized protein (TIGR02996 family)
MIDFATSLREMTAALAAEPDDMVLREVYADLLDDLGNCGQADLVRARLGREIREWLTCPDCLGTKRGKVIYPKHRYEGNMYEPFCQACQGVGQVLLDHTFAWLLGGADR